MEEHILKPIFKNGGVYCKAVYNAFEEKENFRKKDPSHIHSYFELYFNLSGDVSFAVENKVYPIKPGDLILSRKNEFHYCIYNKPAIHRFYCLWLDADESCAYLLAPLVKRVSQSGHHIHLSSQNRKRMENCLKTLSAGYESGTYFSFDSLYALTDMLKLIDGITDDPLSPNDMPPRLVGILEHIDGNFGQDCSVKALSEKFFISRSTLDRMFAKYLHTTPTRYLENRRLANAKALLKNGASVQMTYEQCGFSDYSRFIQLFKKRFGITPFKFSKSSGHSEKDFKK